MKYHPKVLFWCHVDLKMVVWLWAHIYEEADYDHQLLVMLRWISFSLGQQGIYKLIRYNLIDLVKWLFFIKNLCFFRLQIQLGVNMPARAELLPGVEEKQMFHEVYDVVLYLGIIDILQEYNITKKIEHKYKSLQFDSLSISAVDPTYYSERFLHFIQKVFPQNVNANWDSLTLQHSCLPSSSFLKQNVINIERWEGKNGELER